jgi:dTMP kinase
MEREPDDFHARVERAFREIAAAEPDRFVTVDAARSEEDIAREVAEAVIPRLLRAEEEADRA